MNKPLGVLLLSVVAATLLLVVPTPGFTATTGEPPFNVSGIISGPDGPLGEATVFYLSPCNHEFGNTVETDASGYYSFTVQDSSVCIVAVPPLYTRLGQTPRSLTLTGDVSGVDIRAEPGRLLSGRVVDQNGRPAPVHRPGNIPSRLQVGLWDWIGEEQWRRWWLPFTEFSEFTVCLPPGEYFLTAIHPFPTVDLRSGDVLSWAVVADVPPEHQILPPNVTYDEPPPMVDLIEVSAPDEQGMVHLAGAPGAAAPGMPSLRLVNLFTGDFATVPVDPDGSFEADIHAPYGSALNLRYGYWTEFYWAEATGTTIWVYPPDTHRTDDSLAFYLAGRAGNGGWFTATGLLERRSFSPGDTLSTTVEVEVHSPAIDEEFDSGDVWLQAFLNLEPFFDAEGWPRQRVNRGTSFLVAPTGIPIENNALWRWRDYTPLTIVDQVQVTPAHRTGNVVRASFQLSGTVPTDLPAGHYRPALYLRVDLRNQPWDPCLAKLEDTPLLRIPEHQAPPRVEVTFMENFGAYYLPMIRIGEPALPRLTWHLLTNTFTNGVRGTAAREDRGHFAFSTRNVYQPDHLIVPRVEEHSRLPITYRLEPFLPSISSSLAPEPIPPMIPFAFPSGELQVTVQRPDGELDDLGSATFRQSRQGMPEPRYQYYIGSDRTPQRLYETTTLSDQFLYQFPQWGRYLITMTGTIDDVWGNTYQGGGSYEVYAAETLDLEGLFPSTPFQVGDALSPVVVVQPGVPADVSVEFRLYPDSNPAKVISRTLSGRANRYGYFHPGSSLPITMTAPGEYVVDVMAQYWDENGVLWMGSTRGAGVVESPISNLIAHGQRGVTKFMETRPQWFNMSDIHPNGLKEIGPGVPEDQRPMVVYPYHSGDVLWVVDRDNSIIAEISLQDIEGSFAELITARGYQSQNPSNHFGGMDVNKRVNVGEIPIFNTTADGLDAALFPEQVDQWGYFYLSAQRPGISVRAYIGQSWFYRTYWATDYKYDRQLGHGRQGDLENDVKLQFGGAVIKQLGDLLDPGDDGNDHLGYASTEILIRAGAEGNRVFPPFQGCSGHASGGPLLTLKGEEVDLFITPTGVQPGAVLEVGDTFSFSGAVWPNLDSRVWVTATSPAGGQYLTQGRANKYGYLYAPDGDFALEEPGTWTIDVHLVHDSIVPSTGLPAVCHNTGDLLGSRDGQFYVYVVANDSPLLSLELAPDEFLTGPAPLEIAGTVPSGWGDVVGSFTAVMSGYILEDGELTVNGETFSYTFDPLRLHDDFPNLDMLEPEGGAALADTFTFSLLLSGKDGSGQRCHRARTVTLQGHRLIALETDGHAAHQLCLPLVLRNPFVGRAGARKGCQRPAQR